MRRREAKYAAAHATIIARIRVSRIGVQIRTLRGVWVAVVRESRGRPFIHGAEAYCLGARRLQLVGNRRLRRAVAGVVKVDVRLAHWGVIRVEGVNGRRFVRVERQIVDVVGLGIRGAEVDVRAGVGARVGVVEECGGSGRRGGSKGRRGIALPLGGEGEHGGRGGQRAGDVEEPLEGRADGAEGEGVGNMSVGKGIAMANGVREQQRALTAVRDRRLLIQLGDPAAHPTTRKPSNRTRREGSPSSRDHILGLFYQMEGIEDEEKAERVGRGAVVVGNPSPVVE